MTNKDNLKQHVNTGKSITEYQFNELNSDLRKIYLRAKRDVIKNDDFETLKDFEIINSENYFKLFYVNRCIKNNLKISDNVFDSFDDITKNKYLKKIIKNPVSICDTAFKLLDKTQRNVYINKANELDVEFTDYIFDSCDDNQKRMYISQRKSDRYELITNHMFDWCDDALKIKYISTVEYYTFLISDYMFKSLNETTKQFYLNTMLGRSGAILSDFMFDYCDEKQKNKYIDCIFPKEEEAEEYIPEVSDIVFDYFTELQKLRFLKQDYTEFTTHQKKWFKNYKKTQK